MNDLGINQEELLRGKINSETARISWKELQRYFAGGYTLEVDISLDLVEVAYQMQQDNSTQVEEWLGNNLLRQVSSQHARQWHNDDALLWSCVVKPWVLVQATD
jgi:hypothetical protein